MHPEESTYASAIRTRRHLRRYRKVGETIPYASMIDTEHREILRRYTVHVTVVRNCECAALDVVNSGRMVLGGR